MPIELTFREWDRYEPDGWSSHGAVITETSELDKVRSALGAYKTLVIKHWYYRGARSPDLVVVEDIDSFLDYLRENANAGDAIDVYDITGLLSEERCIASGKCPDQGGEIPQRGAY